MYAFAFAFAFVWLRIVGTTGQSRKKEIFIRFPTLVVRTRDFPII